jgi:ubiquinone/menaquinone biosynthesis C-methylase UbiE
VSDFEEQWQHRFERFATRHQSDHQVSGWSLAGLRQRVAIFEGLLDRGLLTPGGRVLELGCGAGTYVRLLGKRGHPVVGVDYSLPSLSRAAAADPLRLGRYVAASGYALPFPSQTFQAVVCIGVLQVMTEPEAAIAEMARVLDGGGLLLVEVLNPWSPIAVKRRLGAFARRQPTQLRYGSLRAISRAMADHDMRTVHRIGIVVPPKFLAGLARPLGRPWLHRGLALVPGVRALAAHAFWLGGSKHAK